MRDIFKRIHPSLRDYLYLCCSFKRYSSKKVGFKRLMGDCLIHRQSPMSLSFLIFIFISFLHRITQSKRNILASRITHGI